MALGNKTALARGRAFHALVQNGFLANTKDGKPKKEWGMPS